MNKSAKYWILAIFIITLSLRLFLAFSVPNLTYDSYYHLRQVEHINEHGTPLFEDQLSYGGRNNVFHPTFHYTAAFFNIFLPLDIVAKVMPNIFLVLLIPIVYLIGKKITNNSTSGIFAALIAAFLPILYSTNNFTPETMFLPLMFLTIYAFMNIKSQFHLYLYLLCFIILSFTTPATSLILVGYVLYLILSMIEGKRINWAELELMIFSLFFFLWAQFLFHKNTLLREGLGFLSQNVPQKIMQEYFPHLSITQSLVLVGIIPFVLGIFVVYQSLFQLKMSKSFLLISLTISTTLLSWLKMMEYTIALSFFAIVIAILFAISHQEISKYIQKTKFFKWKRNLITALLVITVITLILPAIVHALNQETPTNEEIDAFKWLNNNTVKSSRIAASLKEGHLITYYSERKNIMDGQFTLIKDVDDRFQNIKSIFTTGFQTQAIDIFDTYKTTHLVLTPKTKDYYQIEELNYVKGDCFDLIYDQDTKIYQVRCEITTK
jgi:asparagine N-glycosylation enzyme membrane subunit Stt3